MRNFRYGYLEVLSRADWFEEHSSHETMLMLTDSQRNILFEKFIWLDDGPDGFCETR